MSEEALAVAKQTEAPPGALMQVAPQPQGLTPTVVPIDRETLSFYSGMIQMAGLVPLDNTVTADVAKYRVMAKIVAGVSYGFDPVLSQQCFDIMFNALTPNARCMEILFKDTGEYDWREIYLNDTGCKLKILKRVNGIWQPERGQFVGGDWTVIGEVEFTVEMAKKAGLWDKPKSKWPLYPGDMSFARCVSRAVKRFNPGCMRPRTLLGNLFAKQVPQITPPPPEPPAATTPEQLPAPMQEKVDAGGQITSEDMFDPKMNPAADPGVHIDPPFIPNEDDGVEATVTEYPEGVSDTTAPADLAAKSEYVESPDEHAEKLESETVDPEESALIDMREYVQELLSSLPPARQKDILAGKTAPGKANLEELTAYKELLEKETA